MPVLATKLYAPRPRPGAVRRPRLTESLDEGLLTILTLVSAPAGFGKTTVVGEWVAAQTRPTAWLSLDEGDNDPTRFLSYLVAALQTVAADIGEGVLGMLKSPQPPPMETILTTLLNEINAIPENFVLVLDDYHVTDARPVDDALAFLLGHMSPRMHLVIVTREDPQLPLSRLRGRGQLTELRAADLRFTASEAAEFLKGIMGLAVSEDEVAALESRTEGWIAGLQLAAISMRGHEDPASFIESFTGSHRFVLDYLVEEVLGQQSESVQDFLLRTSILDRLCGPLCDAVLLDTSASGQETLEYIEHANLFVVPLDDQRQWYRYHHLFSELLRQRLHQSDASSTNEKSQRVAGLHTRASQWFEDNGLEIEAFQHAAAAHDVERAARLIEGQGMPLHFRGAVSPVLSWLRSLPEAVLDAWPSLWTTYASVLLAAGQVTGVEQKLQAAEAALRDAGPDDKTRDLVGRIAAIRATLAASQNQVETIIVQSRRALEYLRPDNLPFRTSTTWKLGYAYHLQGDRAAASQAYAEVVSIGQASGNTIFTVTATAGLGNLREADNQLYLAARTYRRALQQFGDPPLRVACEAHLGLARISYEWNDLNTAEQHGEQSVQLARRLENSDRFVACEILLARLKLARADLAGAAAILDEAEAFARERDFVYRVPEIAGVRVLALLRRGDLAEAEQLAETHELPLSQARTRVAQGDAVRSLSALEPLRQQAEAKGWADERLKVTILQTIALQAQGENEEAIQLLGEALALAEPGGFIRIFVDEGLPMAGLLSEASARGIMPDYTAKLLAVFESEERKTEDESRLSHAMPSQSLVEPLSQRELEVLRLLARGLSNREIGERLFIALDTVKGHNRRIFGKLGVKRRTEAIVEARSLGILPRQN